MTQPLLYGFSILVMPIKRTTESWLNDTRIMKKKVFGNEFLKTKYFCPSIKNRTFVLHFKHVFQSLAFQIWPNYWKHILHTLITSLIDKLGLLTVPTEQGFQLKTSNVVTVMELTVKLVQAKTNTLICQFNTSAPLLIHQAQKSWQLIYIYFSINWLRVLRFFLSPPTVLLLNSFTSRRLLHSRQAVAYKIMNTISEDG